MQNRMQETLLIIIAAVLVCLSAGLFFIKEKESAKKEQVSLKLGMLRGSINKLQDDIKTHERQQTKLRKKLDELSAESESLQIQITQIQKIYQEAEGHLVSIDEELASSKQQIAAISAEKSVLKDKISAAESQIAGLENRLIMLQQTTNALRAQHRKMVRLGGIKSEDVPEAEQIYESYEEPRRMQENTKIALAVPGYVQQTPQIQQQMRTQNELDVDEEFEKIRQEVMVRDDSLEGEILVVNRAFNFVVVSLGKADGVKEGDRFSIYDNENHLGEVEVETVRKTISAASGGRGLDAYKIRTGNKAYLIKT